MDDNLTPYEALMLVVDVLGTQAELARLCSVSPTAVWKWVQSSKRMPAEYVLRTEARTGVSRHALRPDIYPVEGHGSYPRWHGIDEGAQPVWIGYDPGREPRPLAVDQRVSGVSCERRTVLKRGAA
jgi:DNA-binding transcriptional regulator YdaS (Cro superfamily)